MEIPRFVHPELLPGEIFIMNVSELEFKQFKLPPGLKSLRLGKVAYQTGGKELAYSYYRPLFGVTEGENHE